MRGLQSCCDGTNVKYATSLVEQVGIGFILVGYLFRPPCSRDPKSNQQVPTVLGKTPLHRFSGELHNFVIPSGVITTLHLRHHHPKKRHHHPTKGHNGYHLWSQKAKELHKHKPRNTVNHCAIYHGGSVVYLAGTQVQLYGPYRLHHDPTNFTKAISVTLCHEIVGISSKYV
jgi:hypothetical protein